MTDLNDPLARDLAALAALPIGDGLDGLDSRVFMAIDEQAQRRRDTGRLGTWIVAASLSLGLIGGGIAGLSGAREPTLPIGIERQLVPSVLFS